MAQPVIIRVNASLPEKRSKHMVPIRRRGSMALAFTVANKAAICLPTASNVRTTTGTIPETGIVESVRRRRTTNLQAAQKRENGPNEPAG